MSLLKNTLYGDKNIALIKSLVSKRILNSIGVDMNRDKNFINILGQVMREVIEQEIEKVAFLELSDAVIKINNIIILESVNFLVSQIDRSMDMPAQIDNPTPPIREDVAIDFLKPTEPVVQPEQPKPQRKDILYNINSKSFDYINGSFVYDGDLEGMGEIQLLSVMIDNVDCNVSENKNIIVVDQQEIEIYPGNYTQTSLLGCLKDKFPDILCISMDKSTGRYIFTCKEQCKIDFTSKNSIYSVMGFERKIYTIKPDEKLIGNPCIFKNTPYVDASIVFKYKEETKNSLELRIPMDIRRGDTKFFYPPVKQVITNYSTMGQIVVSFRDYESREYPLRNRDFHISLLIQKNYLF